MEDKGGNPEASEGNAEEGSRGKSSSFPSDFYSGDTLEAGAEKAFLKINDREFFSADADVN